MCGRYSLAKSKIELEERFQAEMLVDFSPRYNIAPTQLVPVITSDSPKGFSFFYWGITPDFGQNKPVSTKLINARAESVHEKVSFKTSFQKRRCLIPADGFYEWKKVGKKTKIPHRFTLRDEEPFAFAGIWEEYETVSGESQHTFLILTTSPNDVVSEVHDRMPVILEPGAEAAWLAPGPGSAVRELLSPFQATTRIPVGRAVGDAAHDAPDCIEPVEPGPDEPAAPTLF